MSEENKNVVMTLRQKIAARKALPKIVPVDVPGLGTVRVKRISGVESAAFPTGFDAVAATCLDETDKPLFASGKEAGEDRGLFVALWEAYDRVNTLDVEAAAKN